MNPTITPNTWNQWRHKGLVPSDEEVVAMMQQLVDARLALDLIYNKEAFLATRVITVDYNALHVVARNRGIEYEKIPKLK